ncbi:serine hydrolase [Sungkyunkwania multivorans]|uniref:Serine hydrolase n=1 Tax=Sungkyunkwania multivorans TaxID=1173618 RepID=A0ABW3D2R2_9FLAO
MKNLLKSTICFCASMLTGMLVCANSTPSGAMNTTAMKNWSAKHGMTPQKYQSEFNNLHKKGYRLTAVDGYYVNGKVYFAGLWEKSGSLNYKARHGLSGKQYQAEFTKNHKAGYRLVHVDGYYDGKQARYAAIWRKQHTSGLIARHGLTGAQYQKEFTNNHKKGYRLVHVSGYGIKGKAYYAAIWKKGSTSGYKARHGLTSSQYQAEFNKNVKNGYKLTHVDSYDVGGKVYYACIFEKVNGRYSARHGMNSKNYQLYFDNYYYQGFRPISVSGHDAGKGAGYAAAFKSVGGWNSSDLGQLDAKIKKVMKDYKIPGVSIGIVKDGKLVLAKGYGYGEKDKKEIAAATSLFRLASVSKPITGVAVMQLVEQGKLKLSDKVFGKGQILGTKYGSKSYGNREKVITVGQLLEHTAGGHSWDNNQKPNATVDKWGGAMKITTSETHAATIARVLDDRNPTHTPGSLYEYSNFGFCVLGRVIEKKTGMTYEKYLRDKVLKKCGIKYMYIGSSSKKGRKYKEVAYYAGSGNGAYNLKMLKMDAHGGWIASSVDLMRFIVRVDGQPSKKDILKKSTFDVMTTGSSANSGYAKGWGVNSSGSRMSHSGGMSGTSTVLKKMNNSISYVILSNSSGNGDGQGGALATAIEQGINGVKSWPNLDLF